MTAEAASSLAPQIAAIDPWLRLAIPAADIERLLTAAWPDHIQRAIVQHDAPVGAIVVHLDWLLGPYLRHLSVLPAARGSGAGSTAIDWLERLAADNGQRNIWLCVSAFNRPAQEFYLHHGFERIATLEDLVVAGENEILMRRRVGSPRAAGVSA